MQIGDIRYRVSYSPAVMFQTVDEANDGMLFEDFDDFNAAASFACDKANSDFFGVTTIDREVCADAKHDLWDDDTVWYAEAPCSADDLDLNEPHA